MPKKDNTTASSKVAWIKNLPEHGGSWGRGIVSTVEAMEKDIAPLLAKKAELDAAIKVRESVLKGAVKRADREAKGLFSQGQVKSAKSGTTDEAPRTGSRASASA